MTPISLNPVNFFTKYILKPFSPELSPTDRKVAFVASLLLAVFACGVFHLFAFCWSKNVSSIPSSQIQQSNHAIRPSQRQHPNQELSSQQIEKFYPFFCSTVFNVVAAFNAVIVTPEGTKTSSKNPVLVCIAIADLKTSIQISTTIENSKGDGLEDLILDPEVRKNFVEILNNITIKSDRVYNGAIEIIAAVKNNQIPNCYDVSMYQNIGAYNYKQLRSESGTYNFTALQLKGVSQAILGTKMIALNDDIKNKLQSLKNSKEAAKAELISESSSTQSV